MVSIFVDTRDSLVRDAPCHCPYLKSEAPKLNVACWNEVNENAGKYPEIAWAAK
jgi:hypothetical protein